MADNFKVSRVLSQQLIKTLLLKLIGNDELFAECRKIDSTAQDNTGITKQVHGNAEITHHRFLVDGSKCLADLFVEVHPRILKFSTALINNIQTVRVVFVSQALVWLENSLH